ncbi:hypothetical protein HRG_002957 [Hirsutella rhossiliensis]|uniref:Ribonucleases P/MRP subunit Pop8-like domain-containing protein n=1 Tax=Hirsutella rhossiliensis TaxID=111463 RepID=A0A9P8SLA0_9HYPO|nr:uncharacterized protein HRG_02957 [Hirsutella rhossiliensis]KAH0964941.1 hypothetical protein HRG_02957 [Hirsutella rhossiliensis]
MTPSTATPGTRPKSNPKQGLESSYEILTCTIKAPPFSYAHLELYTDRGPDDNGGAAELDNLQVRSYCTAALRQFLGLTGVAISVDILKVEGSECWVRVPRPHLGSFAAAITAWKGTSEGGTHSDGSKLWSCCAQV